MGAVVLPPVPVDQNWEHPILQSYRDIYYAPEAVADSSATGDRVARVEHVDPRSKPVEWELIKITTTELGDGAKRTSNSHQSRYVDPLGELLDNVCSDNRSKAMRQNYDLRACRNSLECGQHDAVNGRAYIRRACVVLGIVEQSADRRNGGKFGWRHPRRRAIRNRPQL